MKIQIKYIFFLFLLGIASKTFSQQIIKGKIVRVSDGDTITLLNENNRQIRIRLYGIDCPEYGQDFSQVATKFTAEKCFRKTVTIRVMDIDRYE